ncbi:hypothetical protein [Paraburkholderia pallida]|uniref:Uncharacterized protein n=1 Tax=Paraburkholderia pallida TaxID=2547399 RepID=A0A4P7CUZ6_9BURK|nr:hypothetical protein [Paraburkholderia pallida]QBQ99955.1 hypothetical protein E1956_22825 [Paraburkholderia pallida]
MNETIRIEQDSRAICVKVLEGPLEKYRRAVSVTMTPIRFRLDGVKVDGHLEAYGDFQSRQSIADDFQSIADTGGRVIAGVFQLKDGTHELGWLLSDSRPVISIASRQAMIQRSIASTPATLRFLTWGSLVAVLGLWAGLRVADISKLLSILLALSGLLGAIAALWALIMGIGQLGTLYTCRRRKATLDAMESARLRYQASTHSTDSAMREGELHGR